MDAGLPPGGHAGIAEQLERILAHGSFARSKRLAGFLRLVVENALAGREPLKEYAIGTAVFARDATYDPQVDPIVRIMAGRLRARLAEYYQDHGASDPILIHIPTGGYAPQFTHRGLSAVTAPPSLVGRTRERHALLARLDAVTRGASQLVGVAGDPGMGKTTFCEAFLASLPPAHLWIATGRCSERLADSEPYMPLIDGLESLTRGPDGASAKDLIRHHASLWSRILFEQSERVDAPPQTQTASKERMRRELAHLVHELSRRRPLVLFIDDVHWVDESTCEMLLYLASKAPSLRLLVVAAYRPSSMSTAHHPWPDVRQRWARIEATFDIELDKLSEAEIREYLGVRFPDSDLPGQLAGLVHRRTEGHPLFMVDLVRYLREESFVQSRNGDWQLARPLEELSDVAPRETQDLIRATLDRLTGADATILRCAAIQGLEFDSMVVARALNLDVVMVEERLEYLTRARLVAPVAEQDFSGGEVSTRYRFHHVLYQNVVYAGVPHAARVHQSARLADVLAGLVGAERSHRAAELGILFETGLNHDQASRYFLEAASNASRVFAHPEALRLADRGLAAVAGVVPSASRDQRELALWMTQGMAQMSIRGYAAPEVDYAHTRARDLCLRLGEDRLLIRVLWRLHTCQVNSGNLERALELAREMRALADRLGADAPIVESLHALGTTLGFMGRLEEAREALERVFEIAPIDQHRFDSSQYVLDPYVTSLCMLARLRVMMGSFDVALNMASRARELARQLAHPMSYAYSLFWVGWVLHERGEHAQAIECLTDAMEDALLNGLPQFVEWGRIARGSSMALSGRLDEGIAEMRTSLANQFAMRNLIERGYCLTLLAEALVLKGLHGEALLACDQALDWASRTENRSYEAETHRIRGEALLAMGGDDSPVLASSEFQQALEIAARTGCGALRLRAAWSQCEFERRFAAPGSAREDLRRAVSGLPPSSAPWMSRAVSALGTS